VSLPDWLPALVRLEDYGGDWRIYEAALYEAFCADFANSQPSIAGQRVAWRRHPMVNGRENTFWHLISRGHEEAGRVRDERRCERIRWPRFLIDLYPDPRLRSWRYRRGRGWNLVIALEDFSYAVVLGIRRDYMLLITAYFVGDERGRRRLRRQYQNAQTHP